MITLRQHQNEAIVNLRQSLRCNRSVILRAPTGFGKTLTAAYMVASAASKGKKVIFTVHRQELVDQSMEAFDLIGIKYGMIAAGFTPDPSQFVQIASIDTLKRRLDKHRECDLLVIDEAHHSVSSGWLNVINHYASAKVVGLTATPCRLDGKGLGEIFHDIVHGKEVSWLIENKFLAPFRAFAPPPPDLSGVHTRMGDYDVRELEKAIDTPKIVGDSVSHYLKLCRDKRAVVFAASINHSKHIASAFRDAGVMALHVDGEMDKSERRQAIQAFRDGHVKVISNCSLISEGFDLPEMDAAILMRPTQSLGLYLQQVGRCLRYSEGKTAIILDHAGCIPRFGMPDDEFEWSLNGRKKGNSKSETSEKIKQCPKCYFVHKPASKCPECGHVYPVKERDTEHVDGELREITAENRQTILTQQQKEFNRKIKKYKTEAELITFAMMNKHPNPEAFARKILKIRETWSNK